MDSTAVDTNSSTATESPEVDCTMTWSQHWDEQYLHLLESAVKMASENEDTTSPTAELTLTEEENGSGSLDGALEDDQDIDICRLCEGKMKSPKILSCLHEFCEVCLKKKLDSEREEEANSPSSPLAKEWMMDLIKCPTCGQKTRLPEKGVSGLLSDSVLEDMIESGSDEKKQIGCTSCKAGDNAIARCRTCENLLCPNCVTAHQFMRCFEEHKVVTFEEMIKSGEGIEHLRKPVFCTVHGVESIKFFCCSCMVPACGECIQKSHSSPDHNVKQLTEAVGSKKDTLADFTKECGKKLTECQKINASLNAAFEDLEMQKDNTRGLIQETFQSYKALLEEIRDTYLKELDELHEKRELCLMERMHKISTYENQLTQAKSFVERVCQHGHAGQVAQLLQTMLTQLNKLCMGLIMPDVPLNTEFKTDASAFASAIKGTFGYFAREKSGMMSLHSPFEPEQFSLPSMLTIGSSGNLMQTQSGQELMNLSNLTGVPLTNIGIGPGIESLSISNVISGLTAVNLGHHPDGSTISGNNSPLSDSGISVDNVSHSSGGNATMMNVAAMAKMHQSQSPLFAPGMSITGPGTAMGNAGNAITSGSGDNSLASILGSNTPVSSSNETNVQHANLAGLASLLNQPPPSTLSTFPNIGSFDQFNSASIPQELGSPNSTYSNEPYPPVRRTNKMNAMQISRFQGGLGDTEIGHWGPQHKQVNEVPLRCKFGQLGPGKGQFNSPHGFCLGNDEDIVVADTNNHRIQVFQKTGEFKYQFGIPGKS